jgi:hypothetical protein
MKTRVTYVSAVIFLAVLLVTFGIVTAQQPELPKETQNFMRAKLQHSQKLLEGISTENYDMIIKHAQELSLLSMESQWNVLRTQKYVDQSAEFRHTIQRLIEAAQEKQIDSTTLSYLDVTLKCVQCHKYVRSDGAKEAIGMEQKNERNDEQKIRR